MLAVGVDRDCLDGFSLAYHFSFLTRFLSLSGRRPDIDRHTVLKGC